MFILRLGLTKLYRLFPYSPALTFPVGNRPVGQGPAFNVVLVDWLIGFDWKNGSCIRKLKNIFIVIFTF